jgi:tRNA pseudouridine38-40 synthase
VQAQLEQALARIADHAVSVTCAGRTDSGVHALGQVVHFDGHASRQPIAWVNGTNRYLPPDIRVLWAQQQTDQFHARYSAIARRYQYIIYNHAVRPALLRHRVTWFAGRLNEHAMTQAATFLIGEHDFSAFRGADCQAKTTSRRLDCLQITRQGDFIAITVQANAFLHHMVRNLVGVLVEIGRDKRPPLWAQQVLLGRERRLAGITAPAQGLYLTEVVYPEVWAIPKPAAVSLFDL